MRKEAQKKISFTPDGVSWFAMPSEITMSSELNPYQYRMLAVLLNRDNLFQSREKLDKFWCGIGWLVSHSGMGKTKVKQTLNELEGLGFITITRNGSKHRENIFHINWDSIKAYKRPMTQQELDKKEEWKADDDNTGPEKAGKPSIAEWWQSEGMVKLKGRFERMAEADRLERRKEYDEAKNLMLTFVCEQVCEDNFKEIWAYLLPFFKQYRNWYDGKLKRMNEYITISRKSFECGEYWKTDE